MKSDAARHQDRNCADKRAINLDRDGRSFIDSKELNLAIPSRSLDQRGKLVRIKGQPEASALFLGWHDHAPIGIGSRVWAREVGIIGPAGTVAMDAGEILFGSASRCRFACRSKGRDADIPRFLALFDRDGDADKHCPVATNDMGGVVLDIEIGMR